MQSAWLQQLEWDAPFPSSDACQWRQFLEELSQLERLQISQWLGIGDERSVFKSSCMDLSTHQRGDTLPRSISESLAQTIPEYFC